jgi:ABC-type uncharacterized transport system auxiliary subunit
MNARPSRARRALVLLPAALAVPALVGCNALSRPAPVKNMFLLEPAAPPAAAQPKQASLRVGSIGVAAPFRGRNFVYRESDLKYSNDFYTEFLVAPASMIAEATARALDRARVFARVAAPGAPSDSDYVLDGFVSALYGDIRNAAKPSAEIAIAYYLSRADSASPFWSKDYRSSAPVAANAPDQFAAALSGAFGEILAELARDLSAVQLPTR